MRNRSRPPALPAAKPAGEFTIRPLTAQEFGLFQAFIYRRAGIYLNESKQSLLSARLQKRLRLLGLNTFGAYYRRVSEGDEEEQVEMLNCISTNETHFFRESEQLDFLEHVAFPKWKDRVASGDMRREIRVWSAGCSMGQEPYSVAMLLLKHFRPHEGWNIQILATDLSTRVLSQAQAGVWPIEKAVEIPESLRKSFMRRGTRSQEGKMKAGQEIRSIVSFERLNLNDDDYPVSGCFDVILCRNVLIYFDKESRKRVIERLLDRLAPAGYFLLGRSETLSGATDRVRGVSPSIYVPTQKQDER